MVIGQYYNKNGEIKDISLNQNLLSFGFANNQTISDKIVNQELILHTFVKSLLSSFGIEKENIKMIPNKFRFTNQQTTDAFISGIDNDGNKLFLLIERKHPPLGFAMPGGMVEKNETPDENMIKEIAEEVSLQENDLISIKEIGKFECSEVRGTVNTTLYEVDVGINIKTAIAGDDASNLKLVNENELKELLEKNMVISHHKELIEKLMNININDLTL